MRTTILWLAICLCLPLKAAEVYLFRHAETESATVTDPGLSRQGQQRAQWLAEYLLERNPDQLHSTDTKRTQQTIQPLHQQTGLQVQHYEPTDLSGLIEKIRAGGTHVIASHRGAIMQLIHLLGGDPGLDIDESEYDRLYHLTVNDESMQVYLSSSEPAHPVISPKAFPLDPAGIAVGQFRYQMLLQGQPAGEAVWNYAKDSERIYLRETTTLERFNTEATISVDLDADLETGRMTFSGTFFGSDTDIQVAWEDGKVNGHSSIPRQPYRTQARIEVDDEWPAGTMERSAALMLAHALKIPQQGQPYAFRWYNSYDSTIRNIQVDNLGTTFLEGQGGEKTEVLQLRLLGGAPSQIFYLSMEIPRQVLRIDVINAPWRYQLIESTLQP